MFMESVQDIAFLMRRATNSMQTRNSQRTFTWQKNIELMLVLSFTKSKQKYCDSGCFAEVVIVPRASTLMESVQVLAFLMLNATESMKRRNIQRMLTWQKNIK
jgi:hypothetical protein